MMNIHPDFRKGILVLAVCALLGFYGVYQVKTMDNEPTPCNPTPVVAPTAIPEPALEPLDWQMGKVFWQ